MEFLQFLDRLIPYDKFLNDVAARVVKMLKTDSDDPEYVSQRKAYEMFGRRNVERGRNMCMCMRTHLCMPAYVHMCVCVFVRVCKNTAII